MANKMKYVTNSQFEEKYNNIEIKKLISSVSKNYKKSLTFQERTFACNYALFRALAYHDDNKGQKFTTNLTWFLNNELIREYNKKYKRGIKICDREDISAYADVFDADTKREIFLEDFNHIIDLMEKYLDELTKSIILEKFLNKKTLKDLSKDFDIDKKTINKKIKNGLKLIREKHYEFCRD